MTARPKPDPEALQMAECAARQRARDSLAALTRLIETVRGDELAGLAAQIGAARVRAERTQAGPAMLETKDA